MAQIGVLVTAAGYVSEADTIVNQLVQVYGAQSATRITVTSLFQSFSPSIASQVRQQNGIFIVGGDIDRARIIRLLRPFGIDSIVLTAIKSVINNGGMVAGNSGLMVYLMDDVIRNVIQ